MSAPTPAPPALARLLERPGLRRVLEAIDGEGEEARVVGGAVRDALLGREPAEIDLATTAPPQEILARAKRAGLRAVPTGIEHGTATLLAGGESFEVTSLREDVETDGRRAKVRFGRDFRADALRRDFTLNALSLSSDGLLHDYVGGLKDVAARKVRFIGEPRRRIREDYLRILRFFRFSAGYARKIDAEGFRACVAERAGLERLSRERVRAELLKLAALDGAAEGFAAMSEAGALGPLLGLAPNPGRLARLRGAGVAVDPLMRLAALCVATPEDAGRLAERLRLSRAEARRLVSAGAAAIALRAAYPPDEAALRRLAYLHGREAAIDGAVLAAEPDEIGPVRAALRAVPLPASPFTGARLVERGLHGPAVGAALRDLEERWIAAGFPDDPALVDTWLDEAAGLRR